MGGLSPSPVFHGGEGLSSYYLHCAANPYDLRPAADLILKAIDERRAVMPSEKTLAVLTSESHVIPSHKELRNLLIARLKERDEKFTVHFELPHNFWAALSRQYTNHFVPDDLYYHCSEYDLKGRGALSAFMAHHKVAYAPLSAHNFAAFCYFNNISAVFNDAAKSKSGMSYLDLKDSHTAAVTRNYIASTDNGFLSSLLLGRDSWGEKIWDFYRQYKKIGTVQPEGMAIRNLAMARRGVDYAAKENSKLIIQQVGSDHIFGYRHRYDHLHYDDSLCAAFRAAGVEVLPVFLTSQREGYGLNFVHEEAYPELPGSVIINGLAQDTFYARWYSEREAFSFRAGAEEEMMERLYQESGKELIFYDDVKSARNRYEALADQHAVEILNAYKKQQP